MMMQDKLEKERNDAKNAVEEYVYDFRDKLCGVFEKFITEEVRLTCVSNVRQNSGFLRFECGLCGDCRGLWDLVQNVEWINFTEVKFKLYLLT